MGDNLKIHQKMRRTLARRLVAPKSDEGGGNLEFGIWNFWPCPRKVTQGIFFQNLDAESVEIRNPPQKIKLNQTTFLKTLRETLTPADLGDWNLPFVSKSRTPPVSRVEQRR
jgi:hypothetical protein